jgi:flagellar operon protein
MSDDFRVQLQQAQSVSAAQTSTQSTARPADGTSFADTLAQVQDVHFSNHAQKRLESRDIELNADSVQRLSNAIDKAEERGGKSSLVMMDDLAFIVNVPQRTVVTALDAGHRGQGVFTQIDSVVFADSSQRAGGSTLDIKG